jgi:hypothetical protein
MSAIDFANTSRVYYADEEPERPRLRFVRITEKEAIRQKEAGEW